jgi:tripartite-type tricarboxylate transporter receptor subunit TctC
METFAISPFMYSKLSYNPSGFVPVVGIGYSDQLLIVTASSPLTSVQDVIAQAKKESGVCVPKTSSGMTKSKPDNIGDEGRQEQVVL